MRPDLLGRGVEELTAKVHAIDPPLGQAAVQARLDPNRVVRKEQRVDIEAKRHRGVAELTDAIHGLQPARHPDLDDAIAERADVGDDVHVAGADVRGAVVDVLDGAVDVTELRLQRRL